MKRKSRNSKLNKNYRLLLIVVLLIAAFHTYGQRVSEPDQLALKSDSLDIFNGHAKIILKKGTLIASKTGHFHEIFPASFDTVKIVSEENFQLRENATLSFYQTSIDKPTTKDGGIATWKYIALFTDRVSHGHQLESGWEKMRRDYLYFVRMTTDDKPELYLEFAFFYIDNKFSFSVLQRPLVVCKTDDPDRLENYMSSVSN